MNFSFWKKAPPEEVRVSAVELSPLEIKLTVQTLLEYYTRISTLKGDDIEKLRQVIKSIADKLQNTLKQEAI